MISLMAGSDAHCIEKAVLSATHIRYKQLTKNELLNSLVPPYQRFSVCSAWFTFDDGSQRHIVRLEGTLPMRYNGSTYNIPMTIWISENFPYSKPICFVNPTTGMSISSVCTYIDRNGMVLSIPSLIKWSYPEHASLTRLFRDLSTSFGNSPPVFATSSSSSGAASTSSASTAATPYPLLDRFPMPTPGGDPQATNAVASPTFMRNSFVSEQQRRSGFKGAQPVASQTQGTIISSDVLRHSLISAVIDKARRKLYVLDHEQRSEIAILQKSGQDLKNGSNRIDELLTTMKTEEDRLSGYLDMVKEKNSALLDAIKKMNDQKESVITNTTGTSNSAKRQQLIDNIIVPTTPLYSQIAQLYADDVAIQDMLFFLGDGLRKKAMSLETYLRFVRELSRRQFFLRATMLKARRVAGLGNV